MPLTHPPRLTGDVHVARDTDQLYDDLATALFGAAIGAVGERDVFHLALSGGSTPEPFYIRLVTDPRYRALPWDRTHLWLVDERRVPAEDPRSNWRMISEALADHVPLRRRQRHPIPAMLDDPAGAYEQEIVEVFGLPAMNPRPTPRMDFVLLGMGEDGHTASLFPGTPAVRESERWVAVADGDAVTPPPRVTMTLPLINHARQVAVLVVGEQKAAAVRRVEESVARGPDPEALPITGVDPEEVADGYLTWYLDPAAAGG